MKVVLSRRALADLERLRAFNAEKNVAAAARINDEILDALESLADFPLRFPLLDPDSPVHVHRMVVEVGSGYVVTYDVPSSPARVRVLAIRSAREAGF